MGFASFMKRNGIGLIVPTFLFLLFLGGFIAFLSILPRDHDIGGHTAIAIAKSAYGFDKVKWIDSRAGALFKETSDEQRLYLGHYVYYIVGEKGGEEVYMAIPSYPEKYKPFTLTWSLAHSFSRVVDKFNENGANYVAEVAYDYYKAPLSSYIDFEVIPHTLMGYAEYFGVGCDGETFYERLDVKGVFHYQWSDSENVYFCMVTQESGELKAYKVVTALR